jgi:hypothetical protein
MGLNVPEQSALIDCTRVANDSLVTTSPLCCARIVCSPNTNASCSESTLKSLSHFISMCSWLKSRTYLKTNNNSQGLNHGLQWNHGYMKLE